MIRISALTIALMLAGFSPALAEPPARLTAGGAALAGVSVDWADAEVSRIIESGGDQVLATHVLARAHSTSRVMQRTNLGYWVPWDGDTASLIDARMPRSAGRITYKILDQSLAGLSAPLTVTLIYTTPAGMKIGQFTVEARR